MRTAMQTQEKEENLQEQEMIMMIELGNLSYHVVESIFSKIPLKSLVQLKSVSKTWLNSITKIRHCYPPTTSIGLVLFLKHKNFQESIFMNLHDQKEYSKFSTIHSSCTHNFPYLIDSCNGLLLYGSINNGFWNYSVSSPVLDQHVTLPISHHVTRGACTSLVYDGWHEFQVICFFWEEVDLNDHTMNCMIFSSESWNWRERKIEILNIDLILQDGFLRGQCFSPGVFLDERLYWIWSLCLLMYDSNGEVFTIFPLPRNHCGKRKGVYSQLLWESEGLLQFCDPVNSGFFIWTFRGNNNDFDLWSFNHFVKLVDFTARNEQDIRLTMGYSVKPCAFNKDLQVLYLHVLPHNIVSYSFENRKLAQVWSYCHDRGEAEDCCYICKIQPFVFASVDLFAFNRLRQPH